MSYEDPTEQRIAQIETAIYNHNYNQAVEQWNEIREKEPDAEKLQDIVLQNLQVNPGMTVKNAYVAAKRTVAKAAGVPVEAIGNRGSSSSSSSSNTPEPKSSGNLNDDIKAAMKAHNWKPRWER